LAGGVLVSVDGGQNWTAANTGLSIFEVRTLVTNAVDASTVYAGGFGGAFKSTDGGATWNGTGLSAYTGSLFADLSNPKIVYAQTGRPFGCSSNERPLLRTADEGATWSDAVSPLNSGCILNVSLASAQPSPLVINPTDPKTLYLGESAEADGYSAVLKSTDGGANWIATWDWFSGLRGAVRALAIDPARPATIYAGIDDFTADSPPAQPMRGLFKSTDGGLTWSNTGLTRNAVNLLAIDPSNSRTFYAAAVGPATELAGFQGLFKSTDGGTTWREINQGLAGVIGNRSISATALVVDRANGSVLYLGTSTRGVFRTVDGGANWAPFNDGLTNLQIRSLAAAPKGPRASYAATASGVFKIVDE
jgi:photosystem II stability/assembly factor-like uncharacterized protein